MKRITIFLLLFHTFILTSLDAQQGETWTNREDLSYFSGSLMKADIEEDLILISNFIESNPDDPLGYIHRARLYASLNRPAESQLDLKVASLLNPLAQMYIKPSLRSEYAAKKSYGYDYKNLEGAFVKSPSRYDDYQKMFENLSAEHSQDSIIVKVIEELNNKNVDEAELLLSNVVVTDLNRALIHDLAGKILLKRMDYGNAIKSFTRAIEEDPLFSIAYHNRSLCYKLIGDYDKAEEDLKTAISINDNISLFYFTYAKLNERNGDENAALEYYSKALEIDADYEEALVNYSQLLKGLGDYEMGLMHLNEAIIKNPDIVENNFLKANLHFIYGDFESAINEYDDFLAKYPDDSDARFNLGLSKVLLRNYEGGCLEITNSLEIEDSKKRRNLYNMFCEDYGK